MKEQSSNKNPLWKGPEVDGITFSMLSTFLVCKERFRIKYLEGLKPIEKFSSSVEYGHMWHVCEENNVPGKNWKDSLLAFTKSLLKKYPTQAEEVHKWYKVCEMQFVVYLDWWKRHEDMKNRKHVVQEYVFCVPYALPNGREVLLRGMWDSVDLVKENGKYGIYIQENKTKGKVVESQLSQQLRMDLQTMIYVIALSNAIALSKSHFPTELKAPINGVRYNVVRRPLSGGKGSIVRHKPTKKNPNGESTDSFYDRLLNIIESNPSDFFTRFNVVITKGDIDKFKAVFLEPVLMNICNWYDAVTSGDESKGLHWTTPFGFYNVLAEGGSTELDEYILTGNSVGLQRVTSLFPELAKT